jgi:hypothetical protein
MDLFIDDIYIKENSPLTYNVDAKNIYSHVVDAQELHLNPLLGDEFVDYLVGLTAPSFREDELIDKYIKPALMWRTLWLLTPFLTNDVRNKGFMVNTDDNASQTIPNEVGYMRKIIQSRASQREDLIIKYIKKYKEDFPLYKEQDGLIKPDNCDKRGGDWDILFY